ncbi:MAG: lipid II flippase MurJ [Actinomycetota bacterium]
MIESGSSPAHVRVARNTALSLVAIFVLGASRFIYNIIVGRRFGAVVLGQVTLATNAALFASLLISGGWQASTARYVAQALGRGSPAQANAIYRRTLYHNTAGGVVVGALLAIALSKIPGINLSSRDVMLSAAILFTYNAYQHLKAAMYGFARVKEYLGFETIASLAMLAGLVIVAIAHSRGSVLLPISIGYALFCVLALVKLGLPHSEPLDPELWKEMRSFTLLAVIGTIASAGFLNLSPVFAGHYDTRVALGHFGAAITLVIPVYYFPRALSLALYPSIAFRHGQNRRDSVRSQLDTSGHALMVLLCPPTAIAAVLAGPILHLLFGASYQSGADILSLMMAATYLSVIQVPYVTTLSGTEKRWYKVPVLASVGGFALGVALWVILGRRYGATGIAWGYLIGSVPQCAIPVWFAGRAFDVSVLSVAVRSALVWLLVGASRLVLGQSPTLAKASTAAAVVLFFFALLFVNDLRGLGKDIRLRLRDRSKQDAVE